MVGGGRGRRGVGRGRLKEIEGEWEDEGFGAGVVGWGRLR